MEEGTAYTGLAFQMHKLRDEMIHMSSICW